MDRAISRHRIATDSASNPAKTQSIRSILTGWGGGLNEPASETPGSPLEREARGGVATEASGWF
jgi:hypothetical protein